MFDFPTNPPAGTTVILPDKSIRVWDGEKWISAPGAPGGGDGSVPDLVVMNLGTLSRTATSLDLTNTRVYEFIIAAPVMALTVTTNTGNGVFITGLLAITQDPVGSRDMAWPSNFRWQGGFAPSLSTVPGSTDLLQVSTMDGGFSWFAAIAMQAPP